MSQPPNPDQTDVTAPDAMLPAPPPVRHAELKAAILLVFMFVLVVGSVVYLMYARGALRSHANAGADGRTIRTAWAWAPT